MLFIWPSSLWLVLLVPVLAALYVWMQRRRRRYALRYASVGLVREAVGRGPGLRRHVPAALYLAAIAAMAFALARPQTVATVPVQEGTVVLAIDVSGSMRAEDIAPNRLEAAKAAARTFVEQQSDTVRIGIVSFSTDASVVQAPTTDKNAVVAAIERLRPQRATAIGRAIVTSLQTIFEGEDEELNALEFDPATAKPTPKPTPARARPPTNPAATIVLLSDGVNNQPPAPLDVVQQAVDRGVRIYTIGLGTPDGTVMHLAGRAFRARLDEATLKRIAGDTDGQYFRAENADSLKNVYQHLATQLVFRTEKTEITAYATALAAVLVLAAGALSLLWLNRLP